MQIRVDPYLKKSHENWKKNGRRRQILYTLAASFFLVGLFTSCLHPAQGLFLCIVGVLIFAVTALQLDGADSKNL
jgi:hypothetical protein